MARTDTHRDNELEEGQQEVSYPWFGPRRDVSGAHDDDEREEIIADLSRFDVFATHGPLIVLGTPRGRAIIHPHSEYPDAVVTVSYAAHGDTALTSFWMNRSSLRDLIAAIQTRGQAVPFQDLLMYEHVEVPR